VRVITAARSALRDWFRPTVVLGWISGCGSPCGRLGRGRGRSAKPFGRGGCGRGTVLLATQLRGGASGLPEGVVIARELEVGYAVREGSAWRLVEGPADWRGRLRGGRGGGGCGRQWGPVCGGTAYVADDAGVGGAGLGGIAPGARRLRPRRGSEGAEPAGGCGPARGAAGPVRGEPPEARRRSARASGQGGIGSEGLKSDKQRLGRACRGTTGRAATNRDNAGGHVDRERSDRVGGTVPKARAARAESGGVGWMLRVPMASAHRSLDFVCFACGLNRG